MVSSTSGAGFVHDRAEMFEDRVGKFRRGGDMGVDAGIQGRHGCFRLEGVLAGIY
jgi:hypothetical protein